MKEYILPGETVCDINEDLRLITSDKGVKFGTDSYLLSAFLKKNNACPAADLGSGTGVISLFAAARCAFTKIHAVEVQENFADLTRRNAAINGFEEKIEVHPADVRDIQSLFRPETFGEVFSNPPYMKAGSGKTSDADETDSARRENFGTADDFVTAASYLLKFGGVFRCVMRPERTADILCSMRTHTLEPKRMIFVYPDAASAPSLVLIEAKKGAAASLKIARPLIVYRDTKEVKDRKYTEDMERVYGEFSLEHLFEK